MSAPLIVALLVAQTPSAEALARAKTLYRAARPAYQAGQYGIALTAFEEAHRLAPAPPIVFSMAQAYRLQYFLSGDPKQLARAIELYREYVRNPGKRRRDASEFLAQLVPMLNTTKTASVAPSTPKKRRTQIFVTASASDARVAVDGGDPIETPAVLDVEPGEHVIVASAPRHAPREVSVVAISESVMPVEVELEPLPAIVRVRADEEMRVYLDGRLLAQTTRAPLRIAPGPRHLVFTHAGHEPYEARVLLEPAGRRSLTVSLEHTTQRWASFGALGLGAALVVAAGGTTAGALVAENDAQALAAQQMGASVTVDELDAYGRHVDRRRVLTITSITLVSSAVLSALAGVFLYILDDGSL